MNKSNTIVLDGSGELTINDAYKIVTLHNKVALSEKAMAQSYASFYFLKEFIKDKLIYGINTGFGPMAQYKVSNEDQIQLQFNLIRSHCSGSGQPIAPENVRGLVLARLNTLSQGFSGIHPDALVLLTELLNRDITPVIYEHGGLGASGDLVQLAHLALTLIGEGDVWYKGTITTTEAAFQQEKLSPIGVHIREGLSVMNGTSAMCGIGIVNLLHAENLLNLATVATSMIVEMVESYDDHFSEQLNAVKHHAGQQAIAASMRSFLQDSGLIKNREQHLYDKKVKENILKDKVQEYYSIRCVPQILGPVLDTLENAKTVIGHEINSVSDNPVIDYNNKNVYHGGNFHGDYAALEMDKIKMSITRLSMLCERQLNFLFNDRLNGKLTPFINKGTLGLNLGMQGMQFPATSTTAENQTLSFPMYVHSIPSNNDNQDIVSMGANAAIIAQKVIMNTYEVLAIEFMAIVQAVEFLGIFEKLSSAGKKWISELQPIVGDFTTDKVRYKDQARVVTFLKRKASEMASKG